MKKQGNNELPVLCWIPYTPVGAEVCVCYSLLYANSLLLQLHPITAKNVVLVLLSQIYQEILFNVIQLKGITWKAIIMMNSNQTGVKLRIAQLSLTAVHLSC